MPGIDRFAAEPLQLNLAVSLHAATDELRDRLVPLNRTYPLDKVFAACDRYVKAHAAQAALRVRGAARGQRHAGAGRRRWAQRLRRPLYHLNLIAYNETGGEFTRPAAGEIEALRGRLERDRRERHGAELPGRRHRGRLRPAGAAPRAAR